MGIILMLVGAIGLAIVFPPILFVYAILIGLAIAADGK